MGNVNETSSGKGTQIRKPNNFILVLPLIGHILEMIRSLTELHYQLVSVMPTSQDLFVKVKPDVHKSGTT